MKKSAEPKNTSTQETEVRPHTQVRTRPFKPTCCMSLYKADYDKLVEYAYAKQVTLRQAFTDAVQALGQMEAKRALDRSSKTGKSKSEK